MSSISSIVSVSDSFGSNIFRKLTSTTSNNVNQHREKYNAYSYLIKKFTNEQNSHEASAAAIDLLKSDSLDSVIGNIVEDLKKYNSISCSYGLDIIICCLKVLSWLFSKIWIDGESFQHVNINKIELKIDAISFPNNNESRNVEHGVHTFGSRAMGVADMLAQLLYSDNLKIVMSCLFMIGQQDVAHVFISIDHSKCSIERGVGTNGESNVIDMTDDMYGNILHRLVYGMAHVCLRDAKGMPSLSQPRPQLDSQPRFGDKKRVVWKERPTECHQILLTGLLNLINQIKQVKQPSKSFEPVPGVAYAELSDLQYYCVKSGLTDYIIDNYVLHPSNQILRVYGLNVIRTLYCDCRVGSFAVCIEFCDLIARYNWKVMEFVFSALAAQLPPSANVKDEIANNNTVRNHQANVITCPGSIVDDSYSQHISLAIESVVPLIVELYVIWISFMDTKELLTSLKTKQVQEVGVIIRPLKIIQDLKTASVLAATTPSLSRCSECDSLCGAQSCLPSTEYAVLSSNCIFALILNVCRRPDKRAVEQKSGASIESSPRACWLDTFRARKLIKTLCSLLYYEISYLYSRSPTSLSSITNSILFSTIVYESGRVAEVDANTSMSDTSGMKDLKTVSDSESVCNARVVYCGEHNGRLDEEFGVGDMPSCCYVHLYAWQNGKCWNRGGTYRKKSKATGADTKDMASRTERLSIISNVIKSFLVLVADTPRRWIQELLNFEFPIAISGQVIRKKSEMSNKRVTIPLKIRLGAFVDSIRKLGECLYIYNCMHPPKVESCGQGRNSSSFGLSESAPIENITVFGTSTSTSSCRGTSRTDGQEASNFFGDCNWTANMNESKLWLAFVSQFWSLLLRPVASSAACAGTPCEGLINMKCDSVELSGDYICMLVDGTVNGFVQNNLLHVADNHAVGVGIPNLNEYSLYRMAKSQEVVLSSALEGNTANALTVDNMFLFQSVCTDKNAYHIPSEKAEAHSTSKSAVSASTAEYENTASVCVQLLRAVSTVFKALRNCRKVAATLSATNTESFDEGNTMADRSDTESSTCHLQSIASIESLGDVLFPSVMTLTQAFVLNVLVYEREFRKGLMYAMDTQHTQNTQCTHGGACTYHDDAQLPVVVESLPAELLMLISKWIECHGLLCVDSVTAIRGRLGGTKNPCPDKWSALLLEWYVWGLHHMSVFNYSVPPVLKASINLLVDPFADSHDDLPVHSLVSTYKEHMGQNMIQYSLLLLNAMTCKGMDGLSDCDLESTIVDFMCETVKRCIRSIIETSTLFPCLLGVPLTYSYHVHCRSDGMLMGGVVGVLKILACFSYHATTELVQLSDMSNSMEKTALPTKSPLLLLSQVCTDFGTNGPALPPQYHLQQPKISFYDVDDSSMTTTNPYPIPCSDSLTMLGVSASKELHSASGVEVESHEGNWEYVVSGIRSIAVLPLVIVQLNTGQSAVSMLCALFGSTVVSTDPNPSPLSVMKHYVQLSQLWIFREKYCYDNILHYILSQYDVNQEIGANSQTDVSFSCTPADASQNGSSQKYSDGSGGMSRANSSGNGWKHCQRVEIRYKRLFSDSVSMVKVSMDGEGLRYKAGLKMYDQCLSPSLAVNDTLGVRFAYELLCSVQETGIPVACSESPEYYLAMTRLCGILLVKSCISLCGVYIYGCDGEDIGARVGCRTLGSAFWSIYQLSQDIRKAQRASCKKPDSLNDCPMDLSIMLVDCARRQTEQLDKLLSCYCDQYVVSSDRGIHSSWDSNSKEHSCTLGAQASFIDYGMDLLQQQLKYMSLSSSVSGTKKSTGGSLCAPITIQYSPNPNSRTHSGLVLLTSDLYTHSGYCCTLYMMLELLLHQIRLYSHISMYLSACGVHSATISATTVDSSPTLCTFGESQYMIEKSQMLIKAILSFFYRGMSQLQLLMNALSALSQEMELKNVRVHVERIQRESMRIVRVFICSVYQYVLLPQSSACPMDVSSENQTDGTTKSSFNNLNMTCDGIQFSQSNSKDSLDVVTDDVEGSPHKKYKVSCDSVVPVSRASGEDNAADLLLSTQIDPVDEYDCCTLCDADIEMEPVTTSDSMHTESNIQRIAMALNQLWKSTILPLHSKTDINTADKSTDNCNDSCDHLKAHNTNRNNTDISSIDRMPYTGFPLRNDIY